MGDCCTLNMLGELLRHRYAVRVLYLANDDDAVQASNAVDVAEGVEHEVLIGFHVACVYLYLEIVVASGVVALGYLVDVLHGVHKLLYEVVGVLLQPYIAQHDYVVAEFVVVDDG